MGRVAFHEKAGSLGSSFAVRRQEFSDFFAHTFTAATPITRVSYLPRETVCKWAKPYSCRGENPYAVTGARREPGLLTRILGTVPEFGVRLHWVERNAWGDKGVGSPGEEGSSGRPTTRG